MKFKPTTQRKNTKKIFGFDIETYDNNKSFYCASIVGDDYEFYCESKEEFIEEIKHPRFRNSFICATNLGFDFWGMFFSIKDLVGKFFPLFRGSNLLFAKSYLYQRDFYLKRPNSSAKTITFIDTMNYCNLSVEKMGNLIGVKKLKKPKCIGRLPVNDEEREEMINYNKRDSEVSYKFMKFLFKAFEQLGATPKLTIASTSMSLFKNKYLKETYYNHQVDDLLDEFKAYYGGRTEAFKRGEISDLNYYDFNSLYPSVMLNEYPNPNTMRRNRLNNISYIESFEGIAEVDVFCPDMKIPLLPYRCPESNKLLFPTGTFRGWYSNVELRKAIELGYVIKKVYNNIYFKEKCRPFYEFVTDLYNKRKQLQKEESPMQEVVKLLMNSLYGKFGQKFQNMDNVIPYPETLEELRKYDEFERIGDSDYIRVKNDMNLPATFCFPIWALYTTAYGRIKLHDILKKSEPYYCDTDSILTKKDYCNSKELGDLKLEMKIDYGVIVKPKFYGFVSDKKDYVKIKGVNSIKSYRAFEKFLLNPTTKFDKYLKFKEAIRRGMIPNEIIASSKTLSLEDNKRIWDNTFSFRYLQESKPLYISSNSTNSVGNVKNKLIRREEV